jgi:hypothetical protein
VQLNGVIPYGTASIALTTIAEQRDDADAQKPAIQHFIGGSWDNPYATPVLHAAPTSREKMVNAGLTPARHVLKSF